MAEPAPVTPLRPLPERVAIKRGMSMTPNEMRALKTMSGATLTELLGGENQDNLDLTAQGLIWVALRRLGYDPSWDEAGDVLPEYLEEEPPARDPTGAVS